MPSDLDRMRQEWMNRHKRFPKPHKPVRRESEVLSMVFEVQDGDGDELKEFMEDAFHMWVDYKNQ